MDNQAKLFPDEKITTLAELELEKAVKIACEIKCKVEALCNKIETVGSIRREKPKVHDVDFVILTPSDTAWLKILQVLKRAKAKINCSGDAVVKVLYPHQNSYVKVDFYRAKPSTFGIHELIRTGSAQHNMWLAGYAISKGMRLKYSQGLIENNRVVAGASEKDVFEALGLPCPESQKREMFDGKPLWFKDF